MSITYYESNLRLEFVVEFKDGSRDWVDPVVKVEETDCEIIVTIEYRGFKNKYHYDKCDMVKWQVRPYDVDTTYDKIGD